MYLCIMCRFRDFATGSHAATAPLPLRRMSCRIGLSVLDFLPAPSDLLLVLTYGIRPHASGSGLWLFDVNLHAAASSMFCTFMHWTFFGAGYF